MQRVAARIELRIISEPKKGTAAFAHHGFGEKTQIFASFHKDGARYRAENSKAMMFPMLRITNPSGDAK
jgi:hypothetical protein